MIHLFGVGEGRNLQNLFTVRNSYLFIFLNSVTSNKGFDARMEQLKYFL